MVATALPHQHVALDYAFLLLTHVICADQQIHSHESRALRSLADQAKVNQATLQEMEKILEQDDTQISFEAVVQKIPVGQQSEAFRQVLAIAYIDGYFSPLEREVVNQLAQLWGISQREIEKMLEEAQGFKNWQTHTDNEDDQLSVGARLLKGAESILSRSLITKLAELAPENIGQRIEQLQREVLLSGPEYDDAIQQCSKIAREDFKYSDQALRQTHTVLKELGNGVQQVIDGIKQKTSGSGEYQTAKGVAEQLEQTRQHLSIEILRDLEAVREAFRAKQRALNHFSIAFMGRTKAGKSTLHAVITGEGWEAIGVGKQRTTRYNRVYEWKNIRIIDTPGIGAPGGKTDEEIARSVIEEADVICYVVTDDSIQESEFAFLEVLKEKTKPLIVLLNIHYNLRDSRRLEHFLKDPDRWFALEGKSGIGGHLNRIHRYAKQHYANDYLDVIPAMLLAAQLSREPEHEKQSKKLFQASRIQNFLNSIRASLIDYGAIRRSQTLLGSTVGSIDAPYQWIAQQAIAYNDLAKQLQGKQQDLKRQIRAAKRDSLEQLQQNIKEIFQSAFNQVRPFAESHWESNENQMNSGWKERLKSLKFEARLKIAPEQASQHFQRSVQEAIEEIGNELKLISQLQSNSFTFTEQDSNFFDKDFVRISGMVLVAAGAILAFVFPPLGLLGIAGGIASWLSGQFKSRDQKRHEAVENISAALNKQLETQREQVLKQVKENFDPYCRSVVTAADAYFEELIQGVEAIANQLQFAQAKLLDSSNYLNRAYAKRILDWATDQYEPLTDISISKRIRKVNRVFGRSFQIQTTTALPLAKSQEEICRILQERVSIQPTSTKL
ncbi:50S ribosome-binding GTPase [Leptolyngbya sp. FACHB-541]|uniref:GTPase n=1 Tax=Leptolyngbya sp. FACHB-541 TaxID=2692810 RepID=UPI0016865598|nr:GTPase [Leptolyngbya sp. FACHB-541]MBD1998127.1 50S ribosome-binding GTPase [Leptolyngbya sp. FACHB-541]